MPATLIHVKSREETDLLVVNRRLVHDYNVISGLVARVAATPDGHTPGLASLRQTKNLDGTRKDHHSYLHYYVIDEDGCRHGNHDLAYWLDIEWSTRMRAARRWLVIYYL